MFRIARSGEPGFDNLQSRTSTSTATIAHGVLPGEDPAIATLWAALGQPDYAAFIQVWVAIGDNLSPRVSSNALSTTIGGAAEQLWDKRESDDYDQYINSLLEPMERNFILAVEAARDHWFRNGFQVDEARRIHNEASETRRPVALRDGLMILLELVPGEYKGGREPGDLTHSRPPRCSRGATKTAISYRSPRSLHST